ncbi:hypothetical protein AB0D71_32010 [Streptomyces avermitilis]|uniref:hypothetical protein n=1 Tax=Streptomyces avermitilis TaxID=33903 RepID=UPI0033C0BDA8
MIVVVVLVASEEDVEPVRRWVRLSCTEQGIYLPALAKIAAERAYRINRVPGRHQ